MPVVLEVIGVLEQTAVTAEELHVRLLTLVACIKCYCSSIDLSYV